ncbi:MULTISPECIES: rhodanese-like domain-containing protein [Streptomyces]|uniref:rhodanese-like domain-containing protein n=1 Tax=Streptomyces TaxID=1883 RepID=UPI001928D22C|nr:rhodanese-like domain-containing protein [Streptomyces sp. SID685]
MRTVTRTTTGSATPQRHEHRNGARPDTDGTATPEESGSRVLGIPAADPETALDHFLRARLACETDPYDVRHDLDAGIGGFVLADARTAAAHAEECLPGALSLPHAELTDAALAALDPAPVYVTYGWGPACNAGSKAAARLAAAGFRVKEMIGGLEYWKRQNHPTTTRR